LYYITQLAAVACPAPLCGLAGEMNGVCVRVYVLMYISKIDQKWLKRLTSNLQA